MYNRNIFKIRCKTLNIIKLFKNENITLIKKCNKKINKKDKHRMKSKLKSNNIKSKSNHHNIKSHILKIIKSKIL